jgi:hypothetical protein
MNRTDGWKFDHEEHREDTEHTEKKRLKISVFSVFCLWALCVEIVVLPFHSIEERYILLSTGY